MSAQLHDWPMFDICMLAPLSTVKLNTLRVLRQYQLNRDTPITVTVSILLEQHFCNFIFFSFASKHCFYRWRLFIIFVNWIFYGCHNCIFLYIIRCSIYIFKCLSKRFCYLHSKNSMPNTKMSAIVLYFIQRVIFPVLFTFCKYKIRYNSAFSIHFAVKILLFWSFFKQVSSLDRLFCP